VAQYTAFHLSVKAPTERQNWTELRSQLCSLVPIISVALRWEVRSTCH